jgi:hypothetical protein
MGEKLADKFPQTPLSLRGAQRRGNPFPIYMGVRIATPSCGMVRNDTEIWESLPLQELPVPSSVAFGATFPPGKVSDPAKFDGLARGAMWASPPTDCKI